MTTIVVVQRPEQRDPLIKLLEAEGLSPEPFEGLRRMIRVPGVKPEDFPLKQHPYVRNISDGDRELKPAAVETTTVEAIGPGNGGWGPARLIRREDPWAEVRPYPMEADFHCLRDGSGVDIFIIDSGVEITHPEFEGRAVQNWWSSASYGSTLDDSGHGTHCSTQAIGGTAGLARGARLISLKFYNSNSGAGESNAVSALGNVLSQHNRKKLDRPSVLFFSWSGFGTGINAAVEELIDAGVVCCFPAGNDATDLDTVVVRPAESDPDNIICGGLQMRDQAYMTTWNENGTNWGNPVDILAPAQSTVGARREVDGGGYRLGNGTSYATPFVAGAVACMLQGYRRLTTRAEVQAVKAKLLANATRGKYRPTRLKNGQLITLPDRILYLDPSVPFEVIPGLTPKYI
ncbi:MAG: hypothetical protein EAS51_13275 [Microbacteriaceae bacterium]|nr:MAG: hypothetical protein EAS51_13275 [Microbacteriaceae bacterium]